MSGDLKKFIRYFYAYNFYGIYIYFLIYWLKTPKIRLPLYGEILIRQNTFDSEIFTQMFIYKQYDLPISGEVKCIIDLGGNNGMSALFFHEKYPEAIIYVVEPDKSNFEALKKNTNNIDKIIPINKAIWKTDGYVNINSGDSWTIKVDEEIGTNLTESITMNTLISNYQISQIDLLKIDIETAEKEIFEADINFLSITRNLFIELHDWLKPGCSQSFFKSLNNYRYKYSISIENTIIADISKMDVG